MYRTIQDSPADWWRSAVIYQVYPRSFADADGDGVGDLPGITSRLDALAELGVDAIWLSPFYRSPQHDAGYDVSDFCDVDPLFGTLEDFDALAARAHELGMRVVVDVVPNHTSSDHEWFSAALAAAPGSPERARYIFREGKGPDGAEPPNDWQSVFGGPAWTRVTEADGTPGQWYLHLFDVTQPDLDWTQEDVRASFDDILRFWLDRGVDGFRVDVAHGLVKADGLPDYTAEEKKGAALGDPATPSPYFAQDGVHEIWRRWHDVVTAHGPDKILVAEAWVQPLPRMALWVRPDEMHQAFNFAYLMTGWDVAELREIIDDSLSSFGAVGAPSTWVLSNHDVVRHATRLALTVFNPQGHGLGPHSPGLPDVEHGIRRARAATLLMLALPGGAYLYQGEELGLPEVLDIADDLRQDPTWFRTQGERFGRDGCRVPIPWEADAPAFGFNTTGESWLPQPADWAPFARDAQRGMEGSTLELYRSALTLRATHALGTGTFAWADAREGTLAFDNGDIRIVTNIDAGPIPLDSLGSDVILASTDLDGALPADATVWLRRDA
ncbi:glycoside hydrolase family 13 protein [Demequina zhanjiangensis]|uniref:Glycoside hydrolase family 13 protein n=1 Tax=Demequina zhanjiangensis TaxID=3051659 RepID=A0ABT8G0U0_9MICO|nr:glycoside hydrolase family 13 protein [Demequina sp. SYSU T00b26]MDN4472627.1 glycoside hydrolase family 13 protein [Demequina sp. SYSU T00b26]